MGAPAPTSSVTPFGGGALQMDSNGSISPQFSGFTVAPSSGSMLFSQSLPLMTMRNNNGSTLVASGAATNSFNVSSTPGTSLALVSAAAVSATQAAVAITETVLPDFYVSGANINVAVDSQYTNSSGTVGTSHNINMLSYLLSATGGMGSNLCSTAAGTVTSSPSISNFTISGATLSPGQRLLNEVKLTIQETGGGSITGQINSIVMS